MVLLALFRLRVTRSWVKRPFVVPGYPVLPAITVTLYAALFVIIAVQQTDLAIGGAFLIALLALIGRMWTLKNSDVIERVAASHPAVDPETPERGSSGGGQLSDRQAFDEPNADDNVEHKEG